MVDLDNALMFDYRHLGLTVLYLANSVLYNYSADQIGTLEEYEYFYKVTLKDPSDSNQKKMHLFEAVDCLDLVMFEVAKKYVRMELVADIKSYIDAIEYTKPTVCLCNPTASCLDYDGFQGAFYKEEMCPQEY